MPPLLEGRIILLLDMLAVRNITNDTELTELVDQARQLLAGVDAKTLSSDQKLRTSVQKGLNEMKRALDTMISEKPSRLLFRSEEE